MIFEVWRCSTSENYFLKTSRTRAVSAAEFVRHYHKLEGAVRQDYHRDDLFFIGAEEFIIRPTYVGHIIEEKV